MCYKHRVDVRFTRMAHGPEAVGRLPDGKVVLATGVAPGDLAEVRVVADHAHHAQAEVVRLIEPSPDRRTAPCRHARSGECGGCPWQHLTDAAQRREKEGLVRRELQRVAPEADVRSILAGEHAFGYRRRAKLGHDGPVLGYRKLRERKLFDINECPILDPRLAAALGEIRTAVTGWPSGNVDVLVDAQGEVIVGGPAEVFAQPNAEAEALLVGLVLEAVPLGVSVAELFAGAGTFTRPLLARGHKVAAWEGDKRSVARLKQRAPGALAHRMDLLGAVSKLDLGQPGAVLLDPPRQGAAPTVPAIVASRAPVVVYVSCDPMTLCRDLGLLRQGGYHVEWVQPIDAFPQTFHVECVARLVRR